MTDINSNWIDDAACAVNPLREVHAWDYNVTKYRTRALLVCSTCPVKLECLKDAQDDPGSEGVRGGELFKVRARRGSDESSSSEVSKL